MRRNVVEKIGQWQISLTRNVHMFSHELKLKNKNLELTLPCEDLAISPKTIGVWLNSVDTSEEIKNEITNLLLEWSKKLNVPFRIYVEKDDFRAN
tara:strand:+ start:552 stop:836 length:285 start_codon:yes stop_codon:yes gene_type:complete